MLALLVPSCLTNLEQVVSILYITRSTTSSDLVTISHVATSLISPARNKLLYQVNDDKLVRSFKLDEIAIGLQFVHRLTASPLRTHLVACSTQTAVAV